MIVATAIFGNAEKHINMLKTWCAGVWKNMPGATVKIYYSGLIRAVIDEIKQVFPVEFIETNTAIQRLPGTPNKMPIWEGIFNDETNYDKQVIVSDCDMLITANLEEVFNKEFDVAYTVADKDFMPFVLNSGIIFVRMNDRARTFLNNWCNTYKAEIRDKINCLDFALLDLYGGWDQYALLLSITKDGTDVKLLGLPNSKYNLLRDWSQEYAEKASAIHYKSKWPEQLLEGKGKKVTKYPYSFGLWKKYQKLYNNKKSIYCKVNSLTDKCKSQQHVNQYKYTVDLILRKAPCNVLVFGCGNDSVFYVDANAGGRTVFIEDMAEYVGDKTEVYNYTYTTIRRDYRELFNKEQSLMMDLPGDIKNTFWDIVLVDGPRGYQDDHPGRMQSIFTAAKIGENLLVHDCNRPVEDLYAKKYCGSLIKEIVPPQGHKRVILRHYRPVRAAV